MTHTVQLIREGDDVILPLPDDIIAALGVVEGDEVSWALQDDGSVLMTKVTRDDG